MARGPRASPTVAIQTTSTASDAVVIKVNEGVTNTGTGGAAIGADITAGTTGSGTITIDTANSGTTGGLDHALGRHAHGQHGGALHAHGRGQRHRRREGFATAARSQISNISAFTDTMTNINTDIGIANTGLQSMVDIGNTMVNAANSTAQTLNSSGQTTAQTTAYSQLSSMLGILNLQAGDRDPFSGSAINTPAVAQIVRETCRKSFDRRRQRTDRVKPDPATSTNRLVSGSGTDHDWQTIAQVADDLVKDGVPPSTGKSVTPCCR